MPTFTYLAMDTKGQEIKGIIEADSLKSARQRLRDQGYFPMNVEAYSQRKSVMLSGWRKLFQPPVRLPIKELALITRQFSTLLAAGIPLEEVIYTVTEQTDKAKTKNILLSVRSRVLEGYTLAESLADFPSVFPALYRATIAAGEQTGRLDTVLIELANYTERQQVMRQKIQQAMIYPTLMTIVSMMIVIFLMLFVVPKMVAVFISNAQALPLSTTILIAISHSMRYIVPLFFVFFIGGGIALIRGMKKSQAFKYRIDSYCLRLPVIGKTIKILNTTRFSRTLGILLMAGVPVLEAMKMAGELILSSPIQQSIREATHRVREGMAIHKALKIKGYFPAMSLHLIASGENSGQLEAMLERAADYQEATLSAQIDTVLTLFEPLLILVMGSVVLFIVMAVLLPIFSLNQTIS